MLKNLVICCDGTNNSLQRDLTNVARLAQVSVNATGAQHVYYDVGVGVEASPGLVTRIGQTISRWSGLAFGTGLVQNVTEAYQELVDHYDAGDRIFLIGFSRGAYTVRVLSGLLHHYGLLTREHRSMAPEVVRKFQSLFPKDNSPDARDPVMRESYLAKTFSEAASIKKSHSVAPEIHFMGLWDTVSSLGWAYEPKTFPNTARMPNVRTVRHALALDERRAKFRTNRVVPAVANQDCREVWFSGVHCDVGGGYPESESGLAKTCLRWMLAEAVKAGLMVDTDKVAALDLDKAIAADDPYFTQHESLDRAWWAIEYVRLPHRRLSDKVWLTEMIRYGGKGWRSIGEQDCVSRSVDRTPNPFVVKNANWEKAVAHIQWIH